MKNYYLPPELKTIAFSRSWLLGVWFSLFPSSPALAQQILDDPENVTACVGEKAVFNASMRACELQNWHVNGATFTLFPVLYVLKANAKRVPGTVENGTIYFQLTISTYGADDYNGANITAVCHTDSGEIIESNPAYVIYKINPQYAVANLTSSVNQTAVTLHWQPWQSDQDKHYVLSVREITGSQTVDGNQPLLTQNETYYEFVPHKCGVYHFKVSAQEILYRECRAAEQRRFASATVTLPEPTISHVEATFNESVVMVSWGPGVESAYRIKITDQDFGLPIYRLCQNCSSLDYTPERCGNFSLDVEVSPARCDHPAFTRATTVYFYIDCPISATEGTTIEETSSDIAPACSNLLWLVIAPFFFVQY